MSQPPVQLHYRQFGDPGAPHTLMFLHGLFGSSANWVGIARRLEADYHIIIPDLRNHGRSPHTQTMGYAEMGRDILQLMQEQALSAAHFVGHSMGGKLAMWLALSQPERLEKLVVADVAPVEYAHRFDAIFSGLRALDLERLPNRQAADRQLARYLENEQLRQYLLQNLVKSADGWSWRLNLPVLQAAIETLSGFPPVHDKGFPGQALFVYGGNSDYVKSAHLPEIRASFPFARLRVLAGAGHWVYADQPTAFVQALRAFL